MRVIFCSTACVTLRTLASGDCMNHSTTTPSVDVILNGIYNAIGIKRNLLGSLYLKDAVKTVLVHPQCVHRQVTKTLYPLVAAR